MRKTRSTARFRSTHSQRPELVIGVGWHTEQDWALIKSAQLLAWCIAHAKVNNAASRAEFVSEQLRNAAAGT